MQNSKLGARRLAGSLCDSHRRRLRGTGRIQNRRRDKMEDGIVFVGLKFKFAIFGIRIFHRLWRVTHTFWGMAI